MSPVIIIPLLVPPLTPPCNGTPWALPVISPSGPVLGFFPYHLRATTASFMEILLICFTHPPLVPLSFPAFAGVNHSGFPFPPIGLPQKILLLYAVSADVSRCLFTMPSYTWCLGGAFLLRSCVAMCRHIDVCHLIRPNHLQPPPFAAAPSSVWGGGS